MLAFVAALMGAAVAVLAACKDQKTVPKWSFVTGMLLLALESVFFGLATQTDQGNEAVRYWQRCRLLTMSFLPGTWLLFSLTYARGNAKEFVKSWRSVLALSFIVPIAGACLFYRNLVRVDVSSLQPDVRLIHLHQAGLALCGMFLISAVLVLMNLERTFRASVGTMRWRIKFMILGLGVLFSVRVYTSSQALLWPGRGLDASILTVDSGGLLLGCGLVLRSLFRRQDVAVYPSFAVLQDSWILFLAGVYLVIVGILAKFIEFLGVDASFEEKAFLILLALVGLTVLGLSERVRLHLRRWFSRFFQRPLYDYRTVWRSFSEAIATRVNQPELCDVAARQVAEIFQALSVSLWLVDEKRENFVFGASTALSPAAAKEINPQPGESQAVLRVMQQSSSPRDIEFSNEDWAAALRRWNPSQFRIGGNRVCVPMTAGRQLVGIMILGDRVGGIYFSLQDFDLLKCACDQVAAGLLTAQLSQRLLQAKELEAFQTMSAFFVHDLKNTASTLNLMLKNLPVHFDNPAFREDALRGVAKTCEHINQLITRLSLLRHELHIRAKEMDLNEVIARVLSGWDGATGVALVKNMQPCPKVLLDQEQMSKVVTNLVLNATEAVGKDGQIVVETGQNNGWAVLSVSDNGCGMDPEFLRNALFRPFQTTKKNGFGIGMFQSKMIVEAHGGRMEVESELKKGTTFRVFLPMQQAIK